MYAKALLKLEKRPSNFCCTISRITRYSFKKSNFFPKCSQAIFYTDRGHSFDALLLYGHELSLTAFDVMVFSFVDLLTHDYLASGIITYFVGQLVCVFRQIGGKRNLSKKSLIDGRFLI